MMLSHSKIERQMAARGVKFVDLAKSMNVSPAAVSQMVARVKAGLDIKPATAANMARGLGCDLEAITAPLARTRRAKAAA